MKVKKDKNSGIQKSETGDELKAEMLEALKTMDELVEGLWKAVPWGKTALTADTIRLLNEAPGKAKRAIAKATGEQQ